MIRALLFDYGGVMSPERAGNLLSDRLARNLDITEEEAVKFIFSNWRDYLKGSLSEEQFWNATETHFNKSIPNEKRDIWNSGEDMKPLPEMVELVENLKSRGYSVGLLSNTIPNTAAGIKTIGGYAPFDFTILSYEVGLAKPDTEIYELALTKLPSIEPTEVIFIDDQERCLAPARKLGMHTVLAISPEQIKKSIEELLS